MCRITLSLRRDDSAWAVGTTATQLGQTTLQFKDPSNPQRASHKLGSSRARLARRLGEEFASTPEPDDIELDQTTLPHFQSSASTSSSVTVCLRPQIPRPSTSDLASDRPSPIAEEEYDSELDDYFNRRRVRAADEESDIASSRVVNLFRTYSQSSIADAAGLTGSRHTVDDRKYDVF